MPLTDSQAYAQQLERDIKNKIRTDYPNQAQDITLRIDQNMGFPPGSGNGAYFVDLIDENGRRLGSAFTVYDVDRILSRFRR